MEFIKKITEQNRKNFVFLGEAGSGKSEIALNFAMHLVKLNDKKVHFFDMDMTKPLFRSRTALAEMEAEGVKFHYEEQFMDAPTLVGGVNRLMRDADSYVVMDVGGDHIGARAVGGFAAELNKGYTNVFYVLNAFRPWSYDIDHIDRTLVDILGVSSVLLDNIKMINNPNLGPETSVDDFIEGCRKMDAMVNPYKKIEFACVREAIYEDVKNQVDVDLMPLHLFLQYPW